MRKIACILSFLILSLAVRAQTAEEILQRVDQIMTEGEKQGISMTGARPGQDEYENPHLGRQDEDGNPDNGGRFYYLVGWRYGLVL